MKGLFLLVILCIALVSSVFSQNGLDQLEDKAFSSMQHNAKDAEILAKQLIEASKKKNNPKFLKYIVNGYTILGIVYKDRGYYISAIHNYLKALRLAEKMNDQARVSATMNNIGDLYKLQKNHLLAIQYFEKSLKIEEKLNSDLQKSIRYYNIGECYQALDSLDLALSYFNNSLIIEQKAKNKEGIIYAYLGLAEVYLKLNRLVEVQRTLQKVAPLISENNVDTYISFQLIQGDYASKNGANQIALAYYSKMIQFSKANDLPNHLLDIYDKIISIYERSGEWKAVAIYYKERNLLEKKINAVEIRNKIQDLTFSNELQKRDLEIKLVQQQRDFLQQLKAYHTKLTWFLLLMLLSVIGYVFYQINKYKNS